MKVQKNISVFMGESNRARQSREMAENKASQGKKSIFAGSLNIQQPDSILLKRQQAQERAMKVVGDAFAGEKKIDADLDSRRQRIKELQSEISAERDKIKAIEDKKKELQKVYGVSEDSQEQKDLELLQRFQRDRLERVPDMFTEEARERVEKLYQEGLTEYQSRCLEVDSGRTGISKKIEEMENEIKQELQIIGDTKIERLKHSPMLDATQMADDIREAAGKEILGMLYEEGKEHIDEETDKRDKQAEKIAEEKKEKEELIEKRKEREEKEAEVLEEIAKEMTTLEDNTTDVQNEVKNIINKLKLIEEDIKGAAVDQNV